MSFDTLEALCRTPHRLVITVCLVLTSLGCMRTAERFCGVDQETLKQYLIRLVESPVIKNDDWVNATSIAVDSVEPSLVSDGKAEVSFVVSLDDRRWRRAYRPFRKVASQPAKAERWTLSRDGSGSPFGR